MSQEGAVEGLLVLGREVQAILLKAKVRLSGRIGHVKLSGHQVGPLLLFELKLVLDSIQVVDVFLLLLVLKLLSGVLHSCLNSALGS